MSDPRSRESGRRPGTRRRALLAACLLASLTLLPACATAIRFGRLPDLSVLESKLEPSHSTRREVRDALGEPRGRGRVFFPMDPEPRDVWYYYYEEATTKDSRRIFLYVFFDADRYGGYMWFSSLPGTGPPLPEAGGDASDLRSSRGGISKPCFMGPTLVSVGWAK